jgi:alkylhydroperoxidase family enzyme
MSYVQNPAEGPTELDQVWGMRPRYYRLFMQDYLTSISRVEPVLVELCRLRMAMLIDSDQDRALRYTPAREAGLKEEKIAALPNYLNSPFFDERERVCIDFAEQFVIQSSSIGDAEVARVQSVLTPEDFIYFVKALSVMDQFARTSAAFNFVPGEVAPSTMSQFELAPANVH